MACGSQIPISNSGGKPLGSVPSSKGDNSISPGLPQLRQCRLRCLLICRHDWQRTASSKWIRSNNEECMGPPMNRNLRQRSTLIRRALRSRRCARFGLRDAQRVESDRSTKPRSLHANKLEPLRLGCQNSWSLWNIRFDARLVIRGLGALEKLPACANCQ